MNKGKKVERTPNQDVYGMLWSMGLGNEAVGYLLVLEMLRRGMAHEALAGEICGILDYAEGLVLEEFPECIIEKTFNELIRKVGEIEIPE